MRISDDAHRALPWIVHSIAQDFELLDVWRLPIVGDGSPGSDFTTFANLLSGEAASAGGAAGLLFRLRQWLGERFGWDELERLPIPGCTENSVVQRLSPELMSEAPPFDPSQDFQLVYQLPDERLAEISNRTVACLDAPQLGCATGRPIRRTHGRLLQSARLLRPPLYGRHYAVSATAGISCDARPPRPSVAPPPSDGLSRRFRVCDSSRRLSRRLPAPLSPRTRQC